ncbi:MAG: extracellular solute-binding protein [Anaerolineae bacterium]|nr:extracellular solute-binding protein [Anaerolineae bacterium]
MNGRPKITVAMLLVLVAMLIVAPIRAQEASPLAGQTIDMSILGIGGWLPSSLGVSMAQELFAPYAQEHYGYTVNFTFQEAPFSALFQKGATSLATHSQEYNIIIADSQWLGAFAEAGWIVKLSDLFDQYPQFDLEVYDPVVRSTYQTYPDGSDEIWGLPQEADVIVLFVRKDLLLDPDERAAFTAEYGWDMPQTFEDFEALTFDKFEQMAAFFTRPEDDLYGTVMQYSKEYDYMTMYLYPFMFSLGGDIWDPATGQIFGILNSEANAAGMGWNKRFLDYQPPGALNFGLSENVDIFTQGKVFSAFQWAAVGLSMITEENRDNVMVVPPPGFEQADGSIKRVYSMGGQPWVVNAFNDDAHMQVAYDFLTWWYLPETQLEFAKRGGNPGLKSVLELPEFDSINPWNAAFRYMLSDGNARDFWHEPNYSEMLAVQQEGWTAYASGQVSDAMNTLNWIACQQQKILFDNVRTDIAPPAECDGITLQ